MMDLSRDLWERFFLMINKALQRSYSQISELLSFSFLGFFSFFLEVVEMASCYNLGTGCTYSDFLFRCTFRWGLFPLALLVSEKPPSDTVSVSSLPFFVVSSPWSSNLIDSSHIEASRRELSSDLRFSSLS